ncbi:MAG: hypothetical protein IJR60_09250 [Eubacterium sp.]|nr:hypothetical protein [Eubacterium sp.]
MKKTITIELPEKKEYYEEVPFLAVKAICEEYEKKIINSNITDTEELYFSFEEKAVEVASKYDYLYNDPIAENFPDYTRHEDWGGFDYYDSMTEEEKEEEGIDNEYVYRLGFGVLIRAYVKEMLDNNYSKIIFNALIEIFGSMEKLNINITESFYDPMFKDFTNFVSLVDRYHKNSPVLKIR